MSPDRQPPKALEIYAELQAPQRSNPQIYVHFSPCTFGHNLLPCLEIISKCRPFLLARRRGCDELAPFVLAARAAAAPPPTPAWGSARTRRPVLAASDVGIGVLTGGSVPRAAGRRGKRGCGSSGQVSGGGIRSARRGVSAQNGELGPLGSQKGCSSGTLLPGSSRLLGGSCS